MEAFPISTGEKRSACKNRKLLVNGCIETGRSKSNSGFNIFSGLVYLLKNVLVVSNFSLGFTLNAVSDLSLVYATP